MKPTTYVTLHNSELDLSSLTLEEAEFFEQAHRAYKESPDWLSFKQKWMNAVLSLYDRDNLPRREAIEKPLYRVIQDFGSRLMVRAGYAKLPGYREQIVAIIESKFKSRREFCEVTGLSETMLSHMLKGRKEVSIPNLTEALEKIGYGLAIVPLAKATGERRTSTR